MKKDLLKLLDLSSQDILTILDTADQLKAMKKAGIQHPFLAGKTLAMIFEKSSTRTRVSFETGMYQLGGNAIYLSDKDSQIGRNEPVEDTARVLSRYCDGIMIRTYGQDEVEELAKYASIPVINGLTDFCHPCQVLADLMTIREHKGKLAGLKLCYIGDGNNMANSLIVGGLKCGMTVSIACPDAYRPDPAVLDFAQQYPGMLQCTPNILAAAKDADVLYTDVWASMGQDGESRQRKLVWSLRAIKSTTPLWPPPIPAPWSSTACPPTGERRSPQRSLRPTPTRSSTRRKTASTPKRPCCICS